MRHDIGRLFPAAGLGRMAVDFSGDALWMDGGFTGSYRYIGGCDGAGVGMSLAGLDRLEGIKHKSGPMEPGFFLLD